MKNFAITMIDVEYSTVGVNSFLPTFGQGT